jgi:glycosyltransferase involved in cell wall biosynthesis
MISYTITACNEEKELAVLLDTLSQHITDDDELVIQLDSEKLTEEVREVIYRYLESIKNLIVIEFPLDKDFSRFKNNLKKYCSKEWIFNIDADEVPSQFLLSNLKTILESNTDIDMFLVPRWNTVFNITPDHITRWGWNFDEQERVNWPDYQTRIYKNTDSIVWENKVHERITGFETYTFFPDDEAYCLYHMKSIQKQESQNLFYQNMG